MTNLELYESITIYFTSITHIRKRLISDHPHQLSQLFGDSWAASIDFINIKYKSICCANNDIIKFNDFNWSDGGGAVLKYSWSTMLYTKSITYFYKTIS